MYITIPIPYVGNHLHVTYYPIIDITIPIPYVGNHLLYYPIIVDTVVKF